MQACPFDNIKRSRLAQFGFFGLYSKNRVQSRCPIGASAIGVPGWPELAFCTASAESILTVSIPKVSMSCVVVSIITVYVLNYLCFCFFLFCRRGLGKLVLQPKPGASLYPVGVGYYFHIFIQLKGEFIGVSAAYIQIIIIENGF